MTLLLELLAFAAIIGGVLLIVSGRGDPMADVEPDRASIGLPETDMTADDVADVRFATALRGYRMDEVDQVLDRLALELDRRDQQLARLTGKPAPEPRVAAPEPPPAAESEPAVVAEPEPAVVAEPEPEPPPAAEPISTGAAAAMADSPDRPAATLAWSWTPEPIVENLPRVSPGGAEQEASDWVEPAEPPAASVPEPDEE